MRWIAISLLTLPACALAPALPVSTPAQEPPEPPFAPSLWGVQVSTPDLAAAVRFYEEALGFALVEQAGASSARLALGGFTLLLVSEEGRTLLPPAEGATRVRPMLRARELEASAEAVAQAGGEVREARPFPLGRVVDARDPWGNAFALVSLTGVPAPADAEGPLAVWELDLDARSFAELEPHLAGLGFCVATRAWLPDALPYDEVGASSLVAHEGATLPAAADARHATVLLDVARLEPELAALRARGACAELPAIHPTAFGRVATLRSADGLAFRLVERSPAQLAFERLRACAGTWEETSSQGWEGSSTIEVIARGTAVVERSTMAAHPGETMLTVFHRDGPDLLLTHVCVAGNQPRLCATEISPDGSELRFTWLDGTNLPSRDAGHMDEVLLRLPDPDTIVSTWSWYQDGTRRPMEEITARRVEPPASLAEEGRAAGGPR